MVAPNPAVTFSSLVQTFYKLTNFTLRILNGCTSVAIKIIRVLSIVCLVLKSYVSVFLKKVVLYLIALVFLGKSDKLVSGNHKGLKVKVSNY